MEKMDLRLPHNGRSSLAVFTLTTILLTLSACGGGGGTTSPVTQASPSSTSDSSTGPSSVDTTAPTVAIAVPSAASSYTTSSATLVLSGIATDDSNLAKVVWSNNRGGTGSKNLTGTSAAWSFSGISLAQGDNVLSVVVQDTVGNTGTTGITVNYVPPNPTPSYTLDISWPANPDNPTGYQVYVSATASSSEQWVQTLTQGVPGWNPDAPATSVSSDAIVAAIGQTAQVCARIRAYNIAGLSSPSEVTCATLP